MFEVVVGLHFGGLVVGLQLVVGVEDLCWLEMHANYKIGVLFASKLISVFLLVVKYKFF